MENKWKAKKKTEALFKIVPLLDFIEFFVDFVLYYLKVTASDSEAL